MIPLEITQWLKEHNKGDLQECSWEEIEQALKATGRTCSKLVRYGRFGERKKKP